MKDFRDLIVWVKAHATAVAVYKMTADFPSDERFGIVSQMRRSAASVPTSIAEGCGRHRDGSKEFQRYIVIATGSITELEYQCILCRDLGYISEDCLKLLVERIAETRRMLVGLEKSL